MGGFWRLVLSIPNIYKENNIRQNRLDRGEIQFVRFAVRRPFLPVSGVSIADELETTNGLEEQRRPFLSVLPVVRFSFTSNLL